MKCVTLSQWLLLYRYEHLPPSMNVFHIPLEQMFLYLKVMANFLIIYGYLQLRQWTFYLSCTCVFIQKICVFFCYMIYSLFYTDRNQQLTGTRIAIYPIQYYCKHGRKKYSNHRIYYFETSIKCFCNVKKMAFLLMCMIKS